MWIAQSMVIIRARPAVPLKRRRRTDRTGPISFMRMSFLQPMATLVKVRPPPHARFTPSVLSLPPLLSLLPLPLFVFHSLDPTHHLQ